MMRACLFAVAMLLVYTPADAVDGFNMPGSDYGNFIADSWVLCRNTCGGESRCQGWTWVKPGIQGPKGHCWLKDRLPNLVRDKNCNSGSHENISERDLKEEGGTNRPGSDYKNSDSATAAACADWCRREDQCAAWSFARPVSHGRPGHCWLKRQVARPVADANFIAGVKFRPRAGRFD